ncbi:MAG: SRPBCC family protein, partial [Rickettsiales bacterium]
EVSHQSANLAEIGPSGGKGRRDEQRPRHAIGCPGLGHGVLGFLPHYEEPDYVETYRNDTEVSAYYRDIYEARVRNLGNRMRVGMSVGTVFPNMSFHANQPRTLLVAHPVGPTEMEMWRYYLVDADAPERVKDMLRHYYLRYSGPAGITESDDMENWTYATAASEGAIARRRHYNYQLGL